METSKIVRGLHARSESGETMAHELFSRRRIDSGTNVPIFVSLRHYLAQVFLCSSVFTVVLVVLVYFSFPRDDIKFERSPGVKAADIVHRRILVVKLSSYS